MNYYKKGQLINKILFMLAAGAVIPAVLIAPNLARVAIPPLRKFARQLEKNAYNVRRTLVSLKKNRLVRVSKKDGETILVITEEGRRRIVRGKFETLAVIPPKKWDKKWRVVLFDIPEQKRKARNALRLKLQELGFYQLQKSCFIFPFECRNQVDFIGEFFQIAHHINYLVVESLEGEQIVRAHFSL